ncbi:MAG: hypothetical protein RLZZ15_2500 [Verrucomicrobiota bacterium]|jgi:tetratricopeptide (TPR) repeat protein
MLHRLPRALLSVLLVASLVAQPAPTPAPASAPATAPTGAAKPTPAELAYWHQLQKELAELRTANLAGGLRSHPLEATAENLSAAVSRLEKFLDRRDKDPVADLGAELKDYRERLTKLCDLALTPLTVAAKFNATFLADGEQRIYRIIEIQKQLEAVDDYKPRLALLHDTLDRRFIAAGDEARPFFQILGVGDKARAAGALGSPEERDTQFLTDAAAIGPAFAELAKGHFVAGRSKHRLNEGLMEPLVETMEKFRKQFGDVPVAQFQEALKTTPNLQQKPGEFILKRHLIALEVLRRTEPIAHMIAMQEFNGAFRRWLGKADDVAPLGLCRDIAVARDGSWFAHVAAEKSLVIRDAATGKIRTTLTTPDPIRSLASALDGSVMIFTAAGLFSANVAHATPKLEPRAQRPSAFLEARLAGAAKADRFVYGLGVMPAMARGGVESTFSTNTNASRITSVAIDAEGRTLVLGYAGDNFSGVGQPTFGVDVIRIPTAEGAPKEGEQIATTRVSAPLNVAALALDLAPDGGLLASAWFGRFGGIVALDDLTDPKSPRKIFTLDGDPYTWVRLVAGQPTRVVAGTRHGTVRVWDAASRELLARFAVPAGPSGVAYALLGEEVVSVALGQSGVHRWKLADGALVASHDGTAPKSDDSAALSTERALHPARETLIALLHAPDDAARLKILETLRGPQAKLLDALGQRATTDHWFATIRANQIIALRKQKRATEGFEIGHKEIVGGTLDLDLVRITLGAGNSAFTAGPNPSLRKRLGELGERAVALFPADLEIQREYRLARADALGEQGKVAEAMKEMDQLGIVDPGEAPHAEFRYGILMFGFNVANKAGRTQDAMRHMIAALDYAQTKENQLMCANNTFALAYQLKDWKTAAQFANVVLNLDPNKKNDQDFIQAARYAYGQANPQPAGVKKK